MSKLRTLAITVTLSLFVSTAVLADADTRVNLNAGGITTAIAELDSADLPDITQAEMDTTRGEGIPIALYYAALYAPSLVSLMQTSIANHFPVMLVRNAWKAAHPK